MEHGLNNRPVWNNKTSRENSSGVEGMNLTEKKLEQEVELELLIRPFYTSQNEPSAEYLNIEDYTSQVAVFENGALAVEPNEVKRFAEIDPKCGLNQLSIAHELCHPVVRFTVDGLLGMKINNFGVVLEKLLSYGQPLLLDMNQLTTFSFGFESVAGNPMGGRTFTHNDQTRSDNALTHYVGMMYYNWLKKNMRLDQYLRARNFIRAQSQTLYAKGHNLALCELQIKYPKLVLPRVRSLSDLVPTDDIDIGDFPQLPYDPKHMGFGGFTSREELLETINRLPSPLKCLEVFFTGFKN